MEASASFHNTTVSIDIGNTRTHIGIINIKELKCLARIDILSKSCEKHILKCISELHKQTGTDQNSPVIISSVIKSSLTDVAGLFNNHEIEVNKFCYTEKLPLKINYKNPELLGTDRIANALYGYARFPGENLILISAGTALTADLLCGQQFMGGTILAGPSMQFKALHNCTDALPEINGKGKCKLPGNTTEECIRAGVLYGTGGALNNIINCYKTLVKGELKVLVTGGAWPLLTDFVDFEHFFLPDLTLIGISLYRHVLIF